MPLLIFLAGTRNKGGTKKGSRKQRPGSKTKSSSRASAQKKRAPSTLEEKLEYVKRLYQKGRIDQTEYDNQVSRIHLTESQKMLQVRVVRKKGIEPGKKGTGRSGKKGSKRKKESEVPTWNSKPASRDAVAKATAKKKQMAAIKRKKALDKKKRVRKKMLQDFEVELRRELGLTKNFKLKISFEEELRRISRKAKVQSPEPEQGAIEKALIQRTEDGHEYILPAIEIVDAEFEEGSRIDEIFIMNEDGLLIRHFTFSSSSRIDEDILASMITVVQNFISDSFGDSKATLKELHMGNFNILILQGEFINSIAISSDDNLKSLEKELEEMIREIEMINSGLKNNWSGDIDEFKGLEECISKLTKNQY